LKKYFNRNIHIDGKRIKKSDKKEVIFRNHESIKNDRKWRKIRK